MRFVGTLGRIRVRMLERVARTDSSKIPSYPVLKRAPPMKSRTVILSIGVALRLLRPGVSAAQDRVAPAPSSSTQTATPPPTSSPQLDVTNPPKGKTDTDSVAPTPTLPVEGTVPIPLPVTRGGEVLTWDPSWRRFDAWDYGLTIVAGSTALAAAIVKPFPAAIHGPVLFDNGARKLRLGTYTDQRTARDVSDVLLSLSITGPFLIDSMVVAFWYRGNKSVAREMALIDLETLAVTAAVQGLVSTFTGRARPYVSSCGNALPSSSLDCDTFGKDRSFFSGHSALSFASASLVCTHHMNLKLFENPTTDALSCVTSYAAAAATGVLRIVGDQHYASDVITGALLGTGIGLALPYFLHYRRGSSTKSASDFRLQLMPTPTGGTALGTF